MFERYERFTDWLVLETRAPFWALIFPTLLLVVGFPALFIMGDDWVLPDWALGLALVACLPMLGMVAVLVPMMLWEMWRQGKSS